MIRTLAIDDEPLALQLVTGYIKDTSFLTFLGGFESPILALEFLEHHPVDLIFMDIHMPDLIGTDFVRNMPAGPKIVFATAYEKFALEGYKLDVVDYLVKPFGYDEFLIAAQKAKRLIDMESLRNNRIDSNDRFLFLNSEYKVIRINFDDILYIEGLKDYVKVFLKNQPKPILTINSLKMMESKLPASRFMRVHRSFIVNLDRVETIERNRIVFGRVYIPVSEQYKEKFSRFIDENFL